MQTVPVRIASGRWGILRGVLGGGYVFRKQFKTTIMNKTIFVAAVKGGRCCNGAHRDRGQVVHYVTPLPVGTNGDWFKKSLCGVEPGRRSYGCSNTNNVVNCPKCLKKYSEVINTTG